MRKQDTPVKGKSSTSKRGASKTAAALKPQPVVIEPPTESGLYLPPLDWATHINERAERKAAKLTGSHRGKPFERARDGFVFTSRRDLKRYLALGNHYSDALTSPDTPRIVQDSI
jgi:hypothetical protein